MRIIQLLLLAGALNGSAAMAVFKFEALLSAPKAGEIGEIMFDRRDWSANGSETGAMPREEFLRYFTEGTFHNEGTYCEIVYRSGQFAEPKNKKGGWVYCSGAFATKAGKVFRWNRVRVGVIEIEDSQHRTGWFILDKEPKTAQPDSSVNGALHRR